MRLDGKLLKTPAITVNAKSRIEVDGKPLQAEEPTRLWRYHKPRALVTTHKDPEGRPTVFEKLPPELPRVISVGRLDYNTEGLLLLTNDGELARHLELPSTAWTRRYRVRVHGRPDPAALEALNRGLTLEGVRYAPIQAEIDSSKGANTWLSVGLQEGKNREIRRVMEHLGLEVTRLIRVSYGPFQLGDLARGEVKQIPNRVLRDQLGNVAQHLDLKGHSGEQSREQNQNAHRRR